MRFIPISVHLILIGRAAHRGCRLKVGTDFGELSRAVADSTLSIQIKMIEFNNFRHSTPAIASRSGEAGGLGIFNFRHFI